VDSVETDMKVLLCEDIEKLGWVGDIVEVSEGYARNYLLPHRLGIIPTKGNLRSLAQAKAKRAEELKVVSQRAEQAASAVAGAEVVISAKANEQGHLFGSVGPHDIAAKLREQGFEVADESAHMSEHIKDVGTHEVTLIFKKPAEGGLIAEITEKINVVVVAEGAELQPEVQQGEVKDQPDSAAPGQQDSPAAS
jgi:large subunit ribosomal protein L9